MVRNGKLSFFLLILFIGHLVWNTCGYAGDPVRVTFLNPDKKGNEFWDLTTSFMKAAASDLKMELNVVYSPGRNRFEYMKLAETVLSGDDKPDYLICIFRSNASRQLLQTAERNGVQCFSINTDVPKEDLNAIGKPRVNSKSWIGQMVPDDKQAGYRLARILIESAKASGVQRTGQKLQVIGLTGSRDSSAALARNDGLKQAIKEHPETVLNQLVFTEWNLDISRQKAGQLLDRYPDTHIIWCASDGISLAAQQALAMRKRSPGKDVFTGGIDWSPDGLKAVKAGKMTTTLGGHFMEGGWAMVLLHDYHHGKDFADELGTRIDTELSAITPGNIALYEKQIREHDWQGISFKKLSKVHNAKRLKYDFTLEGAFNSRKTPEEDNGKVQP